MRISNSNLKFLRDVKTYISSLKILLMVTFICYLVKLEAQDLSNLSTKDPIKIVGSFTGRTTFYNSSNLSARRVPFSWQASGGATITLLNGLQIPLSFIFSEQSRSFSQPFNQFGMSPRYKGLTLHAGYRNLNFSEFTLAGQSIFGGGVEIQQGQLRAGFIGGRFNRASIGFQSQDPTFYRQGFAAKIGYGKNDSYLDLIILSAGDVEKSIENYTNIQTFTPKKNTVFGVNFRKQLFKNLTISAETALSVFTNDITARNLDSFNVPAIVDEFGANISSEPAIAIRSGLEYRNSSWGIALGFQQIDAGYRSMGAYYLYNDMQMFSAAPNFSFLNGKISLNGNLVLQKDNLKKYQSITTNRFSPSASLGLNLSQKFGIDLQGQLFTTNQSIENPLLALEENLQNNSLYSFTASPRWNLNSQTTSHSINISLGWQTLKDQNLISRDYSQFNSITGGIFYALSLLSTKTSINVGANYSGFNTVLVSSKPTFSFNGGASRSFDKGKYSVSGNSSISLSEFSRASNFSGNFMYQLNKHNQFTASLNALWINFSNDLIPTGNEQRVTCQYRYNF
jgi:hypothetical protein